MIPFSFLRKILVTIAPLVLLYLLRKKEEKTTKRQSSLSGFDPSTKLGTGKSKIVEGEIVEEKKKKDGK